MEQSGSTAGIRNLIKSILIILWVTLLLAGYFIAHKPLAGGLALGKISVWDWSGLLAGILRTIGSILVWEMMLLVAAGWGKKIAGKWLKDEPLLIQLSLQIVLGMGLLFLLMLGLGLLGLIHRWVAWGLFLVLGGLAWRECRHWATILWTKRTNLIPKAATSQQKWLKIFTTITLCLAFLLALSPDISFDAHLYHLAMPKIYIEQGRIRHFFDMFVFGFPQMMEMLYTWGMLLWSDQIPPMLHFAFGVMGLIWAGSIANRYFSRNAAWWTIALLCSVPTLTGLLSVTYTDLGLMCMATGMMYAFLRWREGWQAGEEQLFWLVIAGILTGLLGNIKYTSVTMPFSIAGGIVLTSWRSGLPALLKRLFLVGGIAGILVTPWLAKNLWQTGNPVYPFFIDEALYWDEWRGDFYENTQTGFYYTEPARLLYAPLELSLFGTEGTNFYDATIAPFVIGLAFLLPLVWFAFSPEKTANSRLFTPLFWDELPLLALWRSPVRFIGTREIVDLYFAQHCHYFCRCARPVAPIAEFARY